MVKLREYDQDFVNKYREKFGNKIYKKIYGNRNPIWRKYFPQSYLNSDINIDFFRDIVSMPLSQVCDSYPSVRDYYNYAFLASLDLDTILKGRLDKKEICRDYYDYYIKGNMLFLNLHTNFPQNKGMDDVTFLKFWQIKMRDKLDELNNKILLYIDYDMINAKDRCDILDGLRIKSCPYCNRQYVVKLRINENKYKSIGDIDHFYPKKYFALFGLSLYNFVPSCKICNSLFKGEKNLDIQNPYEMEEDCNVEFSIKRNNVELKPGDLFGWNDDISIEVTGNSNDHDKRIQEEREIELFQLNAQYEIHKEYARDFLYKKNVLHGMNKGQIIKIFQKQHVRITNRQIDEMLFGFDMDNIANLDLSKKPLSKLTKDLYEKY